MSRSARSRRSRSRSRRHSRFTPDIPSPGMPLTGPEEALRIVLAAASDPPRAETIAVLLDGAHRGLRPCVVCDGASSARQVVELGELLVAVAVREPALGAVVLASARPGRGIELAADDEAAFYELRHDMADIGVDLLDWFLLDDGLAASVCELTDGCWHWTTESPKW